MTQTIFSIDKLRSKIGGFAKGNRYNVTFAGLPTGWDTTVNEKVQYLCEAISLPTKGIASNAQDIYGPPRDRAVLMDELKEYTTNNKYDATTRLKITYDLLKGFGRAVPCVKRYLGTNVRSNTVRINADEWEIAIFLPVERFQKQKKSVVWNDSRKYY